MECTLPPLCLVWLKHCLCAAHPPAQLYHTCLREGFPAILQTDNGSEFCARWAVDGVGGCVHGCRLSPTLARCAM